MENKMRMDRSEVSPTLTKNWGWLMALGACMVVLGFIAMYMPVVSTVSLMFALAGIFVAYGVVQLIHAFKLRGETGSMMRMFQGILSLIVGFLMFRYPGQGLMGVAFALSFYFFMSCAVQGFIAFNAASGPVKTWGIIGAVLSFILGAAILISFPFSALWIPGMLLGIEVLFTGISLIGLSLTARKVDKHLHHTPSFRTSSVT